jgi:hypothetical protein
MKSWTDSFFESTARRTQPANVRNKTKPFMSSLAHKMTPLSGIG